MLVKWSTKISEQNHQPLPKTYIEAKSYDKKTPKTGNENITKCIFLLKTCLNVNISNMVKQIFNISQYKCSTYQYLLLIESIFLFFLLPITSELSES